MESGENIELTFLLFMKNPNSNKKISKISDSPAEEVAYKKAVIKEINKIIGSKIALFKLDNPSFS